MTPAFDATAVRIKFARLKSAADSAATISREARDEVPRLTQARRQLDAEIANGELAVEYAICVIGPNAGNLKAAAERKLQAIRDTAASLDAAITESRARSSAASARYQAHARLAGRAEQVLAHLNISGSF